MMPVSRIEEFIASKEDWIREKLALQQDFAQKRAESRFSYDTPVPLRGGLVPIVQTDGERAEFDGERFLLPRDLSPDYIRSAIIGLYKQIAKFHITQRVAHFAPLVGKEPAEIKINDAKSRWGSCSSSGTIRFSWYLIIADEVIIDYVIVHELAHLLEMNHSERFWAIVGRIFPNYRELRTRLQKVYGEQASLIR
jgi:predicted metal-dependent hydrolase